MKSLELVKLNYESWTLDGRDLSRLKIFIPFNQFPFCGMTLKKEVTEEEWNKHVIPFTRENVLKCLESDLDFAFEKALNQRGISSGLMFEVIRMWNWILEEGLEDWSDSNYAFYGLPLFKATAVKYGFDNPIGDDEGTEEKYADS